MAATEAAPCVPGHHKRQDHAAVLLAFAAGAIFADAILWTGTLAEGQNYHPPKAAVFIAPCVILVAIVLSAAAVLCPGNAEKPNDSCRSIDSIKKNSRKEWQFFAFLIFIHGSTMVPIYRLAIESISMQLPSNVKRVTHLSTLLKLDGPQMLIPSETKPRFLFGALWAHIQT